MRYDLLVNLQELDPPIRPTQNRVRTIDECVLYMGILRCMVVSSGTSRPQRSIHMTSKILRFRNSSGNAVLMST